MDSLINAAARALATGDPIGALKRVALRDDAPALAPRGIAMAQLCDLPRAMALLQAAARIWSERGGGPRAVNRGRGRDRACLARFGLACEHACRGAGDSGRARRPRQRGACAAFAGARPGRGSRWRRAVPSGLSCWHRPSRSRTRRCPPFSPAANRGRVRRWRSVPARAPYSGRSIILRRPTRCIRSGAAGHAAG